MSNGSGHKKDDPFHFAPHRKNSNLLGTDNTNTLRLFKGTYSVVLDPNFIRSMKDFTDKQILQL